jgi:serine/threonine-protein kinase
MTTDDQPTRRDTRPISAPANRGEMARAREISSENRFETKERLGEGGMGIVDAVRDRLLERTVARKTLKPELAREEESLDAFVREVRITGRLEHPAILSVFDARLNDPEGPSLLMPRIEGRSLADLIVDMHDQGGPAAQPEMLADLLEVVVRVCEAIAYAHDEGVLHRDLKPQNVLVGEYGQVHVVDWGIALERKPGEQPTVPHAGSDIAGTWAYMAPETIEGMPSLLDARTDVYALGAVLHDIITGRPARQSTNETTESQQLAQVAKGESAAQDLEPGEGRPPELVRIIRKATAPQPDDRHSGVSALRDDLRRFLRGGGALPRLAFAAGETIVRQGEEGDAAWVIVSGRCEVRLERDGKERVVRTLGPGEAFGETAILAPGPRTASVIAVEDSELMQVTAGQLETEVAGLKPWLGAILRGLARALRQSAGSS